MRRRMLWVALMTATLLVVALEYGCGETSFGSCADNGTCAWGGGAADGTADGAPADDAATTADGSQAEGDAGSSGGDGGPASCVATGEPKDEPCLVDDA